MLRDKSLIPLSHQHQRALALCVRIDRAQPIPEADLQIWQTEIEHLFDTEISIHFFVEESVLFPSARQFTELQPLVEELIADHRLIRESFAKVKARTILPDDLPLLAQQLSGHIRKEERQLFEGMQRLMKAEELVDLGQQLAAALKESEKSCLLPSETTRLKPRR